MTRQQRHAQLGRIHAAARQLRLDEDAYRDLLEGLTGVRSAGDMTDQQLNHSLDWLAYLAGWRQIQPRSFGRDGGARANLARLLRAIQDLIPPGYDRPPLRAQSFITRTSGAADRLPFEQMTVPMLTRLIEAVKAIWRRAGHRHGETLDQLPLGPDRGHSGASPDPAPETSF